MPSECPSEVSVDSLSATSWMIRFFLHGTFWDKVFFDFFKVGQCGIILIFLWFFPLHFQIGHNVIRNRYICIISPFFFRNLGKIIGTSQECP